MNITEKQLAVIVARAVEEVLERAKLLEKPRLRPKPREIYYQEPTNGGGCGRRGESGGGGCGR